MPGANSEEEAWDSAGIRGAASATATTRRGASAASSSSRNAWKAGGAPPSAHAGHAGRAGRSRAQAKEENEGAALDKAAGHESQEHILRRFKGKSYPFPLCLLLSKGKLTFLAERRRA